MDNATFSRHDIFDFLISKDFVYSARSWFTEKGVDGVITHLEVSNWFQTYFPTHNAYKLFRELQSEKTQYLQF